MCSAPFRESFERGFVLWNPGQGRIQRAEYFIHMFLLNDVRGQEAQHGLVGAIDEDSLLQQSRDDGFRGFDRIEIHPEHQRSEEHTSELQSPCNLVCRLLLEKKNRRL